MAVKETVWLEEIVRLKMLKVPVLELAATTAARGRPSRPGGVLLRVSTAPPAGAGVPRVTVQVPLVLEASVVGLHSKADTGAFNVRMTL